MVVDAAPHLLSTLQALLGPGQLQDIDTEFQHLPDLGAHAHGLITLGYMQPASRSSSVAVSRPRNRRAMPLNGAFMQRHLEPANYMISFQNEGRRVLARDPLAGCVEILLMPCKRGVNLTEPV